MPDPPDDQRQLRLPIDPRRHDRETVYAVTPPGLITVGSAARKYGIPRHLVNNLIRRNHLFARGRLKAGGPGGGHLLVDEAELITVLKDRNVL